MRLDLNRLAFLALVAGIALAVVAGASLLRRPGRPPAAAGSASARQQPDRRRVPRPMIDPAWKTSLVDALPGSGTRLVELQDDGSSGVRAIYAGPPDSLVVVLARLERSHLPLGRVWIGPPVEETAGGLLLRVEVGSRIRRGR